jgi:hypothetical protein
MKFRKFGKALVMSALSAGVVLSVTSCIQSYTVGYLYVLGTVTAQSPGYGNITGVQIDHNTGRMTALRGLPVASGGANPIRAVLVNGSRFLYVLNRGVTASGSSNCTTLDPCQNSNITQFAVGANGVLTAQPEVFYTQGLNPFRIIGDSSGNYIYVLDHDAPDNTQCHLALGAGVNSCGDITAFKADATTGRLSLVVNAQVTAANNRPLPYFPVPSNPVDFVLASSNILTLSSSTAQTSFPYVGGSQVFPYTYSALSGQLTVNQNSSQPLGILQGTAIVTGSGYIYVLDNEPPSPNSTNALSQILPYTLGSNGALQSQTGGAVPDDPTLANPIALLVESKGKWVYVANAGNNNTSTGTTQDGIAGYVVDPSSHQLTTMAGEPFTTGSGPQCLVEDPSNQFVYTANFNDSTITGRVIDQNAGVLHSLNGASSFPLTGPATWCVFDGRTN